MQKALGITALILAVISIFIPVVGWMLTVVVAIMAVLSYGSGFAFGLSALIINLVNILLLSPSMLLSAHAAQSQGKPNSTFAILLLTQLVSIVILWFLNRNKKNTSSESA